MSVLADRPPLGGPRSATAFTVVIASGRPLIRHGLARLAEQSGHLQLAAEAASLADAIMQTRVHSPVAVLVDLGGVAIDLGPPASLTRLVSEAQAVVALTGVLSTAEVHALLSIGIRGVVPDDASPELVLDALEAVRRGALYGVAASTNRRDPLPRSSSQRRPRITERERQVLQQLVRGRTNREIGHALHISETTVKYHVMNLVRKCHAQGRTELAFLASELDLLTTPTSPEG